MNIDSVNRTCAFLKLAHLGSNIELEDTYSPRFPSRADTNGILVTAVKPTEVGQPKFFWDFRLKLHGEVWAKSCLDTNFQPIRKSFDHDTEAPKVPA